jgi:hypothetical protein
MNMGIFRADSSMLLRIVVVIPWVWNAANAEILLLLRRNEDGKKSKGTNGNVGKCRE